MYKKTNCVFYLFFMLLCSTLCIAQIKIETYTGKNLDNFVKENLLGEGIYAFNIKYTGNPKALAMFNSEKKIFEFNEGLLLSTGDADDIAHVNDINNKWSANGTRSDKDLNRIGKGITVDAAVLEFDFIAIKNKITFNYFFASEEYMEYADSKYNDVFAFLVNGNGVRKRNIALLPDKKTIVSVNNINQFKNGELYVNNNIFTDKGGKMKLNKKRMKSLNNDLLAYFQYDGLTVPLKAEVNLLPGQKYHIKIAIADVGDFKYDSGVFIEKNSFVAIQDTSARSNFIYTFNPQDTLAIVVSKEDTKILKQNKVNDNLKETIKPEEKKLDYLNKLNIYFASDSYEIPDSSKLQLGKIAMQLLKNKSLYIEIRGYADTTGSKEYNKTLSINRAKSVFDFLNFKEVDMSKIRFEGFGSNANKEATLDKKQSLYLNRRVELIVKEDIVVEK